MCDRNLTLLVLNLLLLISWCPGPGGRDVRGAEPARSLGYERLSEARIGGDARAAAEVLFGELNCVACHAAPALAERSSAKSAPILTNVSARVKPAYLRAFLENPTQAKPGTTMPHVLHGLAAEERREVVESLVHFLTSLGGAPREEWPVVGSRSRGDTLYHTLGCAACHGPRQADQATDAAGQLPLRDPSPKYTLPGLASFLAAPLQVRPSARMPHLNLSGEEASNIAAFLLKLPEVSRIRYAYYEGSWNELPDFTQLQPVEVGGAEQLDVSPAKRREQFGLRFESFLRIDRDGIYRFRLRSDDGSRLTIDGAVVVDNDGIHAPSEKTGETKLLAGLHPLSVDYFEQGGGEELSVEIEGPGLPRGPLALQLVGQHPEGAAVPPTYALALDPQRIAEGRQHFGRLGCAACHGVEEQGQRLEPRGAAAPSWDAVRPRSGCLANEPPRAAPRYALSEQQRTDLTGLIGGGPSSPLTLEQRLHRSLAVWNCYGCHERGGVGGASGARSALFVGTTPEMGDEGRLPPPLNGVGGKLTSAWLQRTLASGAKDRPYVLTRMPGFGEANVATIAAALETLDRLEPLPAATFAAPLAEVKDVGRILVGETGFSCIKCHTFGRFPAQGVQSINLQIMQGRLREEWFRPYMRNPAAFRPGTRMPSAWPPLGKSILHEYLDGDSDQQVAAIWSYLADGERARIPSGLVIPSMELVPVERAIIYRNFIEGAGTRAIGVGFPEGIHLAFDANNMRPALLWQGRFIDASRHWSGRGQGFEGPAGEKILKLVDGPPFARLSSTAEAWPTEPARKSGYQFEGYTLTADDRPTFVYSFADVSVRDQLDPQRLSPGDPLPRRLTLAWDATESGSSPPANLWFRAAAAREIVDQGEGWYLLDGAWRLRVTTSGGGTPLLRDSAGRMELLVPVEFRNGTAQIDEHFAW